MRAMVTLHGRSTTLMFLASENRCRKENLVSFSRRGLRSSGMQNESPRLSWKVALAGIVACVLAVGSARAQDLRTIEGQVFIRKNAGETLKLSLVEVQLFDEKSIRENVENKRKTAEPIAAYLSPIAEKASDAFWKRPVEIWEREILEESKRENYKKLQARNCFPQSASFYFQEMPNPLQTTRTDADGKFAFQVPSGRYVLVATSSRFVGVDTKLGAIALMLPTTLYYNWMVKVNLSANTKVILANDNLTSSGSPDSLIQTSGDEQSFREQMKGIDIRSLAAFVEKDKREQVAVEDARQEAARQAQLEAIRKDPQAAQRKAIELYPDLAVAGSPLNKEFVERVKTYRFEKKEFFAEPDWPVRLAKECSEALAAKPVPK